MNTAALNTLSHAIDTVIDKYLNGFCEGCEALSPNFPSLLKKELFKTISTKLWDEGA